jgi:hypothetical protein
MGELLISLTSQQVGMGTAHLARITLDIEEWCKCEPGVGRLNWIISPAELEGRTFSQPHRQSKPLRSSLFVLQNSHFAVLSEN